jgi:RNA polymerase sigma-70 factor (ECF subfamily)
VSDWAGLADLADEELIASSQAGDKKAFGELVCRYRGRVQATVYRFCSDPHLAEDIAQETFVKIWRNLSRFRAGNFRSWIYRIAINTAIDHARRARPTVDIEDLPLAASGDNPEGAVLRMEHAQAIRQAVLRLPPHSRAALILREYEGLSYKEIAGALDIPLGTVMSRLNYARNRLRDDLAPLLEEAHASTNH